MKKDKKIIQHLFLIRKASGFVFCLLILGIIIHFFGRNQLLSYRNQKMILQLLRICNFFIICMSLYGIIITAAYRKMVEGSIRGFMGRYTTYILCAILSTFLVTVWDVFMLPDNIGG